MLKIIILVFLLSCRTLFAAQIEVSVDRNPVNLGESFQVTFKTEESPDEQPDFSVLEQDFMIVNSQTGENFSWINGQTTKTIKWIVTLMPKTTGQLEIPAISFGSDVTEPIIVNVNQATVDKNNVSKEPQDVLIETQISDNQPYLQSQVIFTLRLLSRTDIEAAQFSEPDLQINDALVELLGETRYVAQRHHENFNVIERKYAIFPQKSGNLILQPLIVNADIVAQKAASPFDRFFQQQFAKRKTLKSDALYLDVKAIPADFSGHWLAAEKLTLTQSFSSDVTQVKVGEPITRTVLLNVEGAAVGQLPDLNSTVQQPDLKTYSDQPILNEQKNAQGLIASKEEKMAFIPSKIGNYILPATEIPWFNTQTKQVEIATLPEVTLTAIENTAEKTIENTNQSDVESAKVSDAKNVSPNSSSSLFKNSWFYISLFLVSGWSCTSFYFLRKMRKLTIKEINVTDNKKTQSMKYAMDQLKKACADDDPNGAKDALLIWGCEIYGTTQLNALLNYVDARLRDEILLLNEVLYNKNTRIWEGKKLLQAFSEHKARAKLRTSNEGEKEILDNLHYI